MIRQSYGGVDHLKLIAAILVIAIHTGPLTSYSPYANFILTSIVARIAVPFFFIASGYFFFSKLTGDKRQDFLALRGFSYNIALLYVIAIVLYLPLNVYAKYFAEPFSMSSLVKDILFNGTFYHLWYLPALLLGMLIVYWLHAKLAARYMLTAAAILYLIALLGDSYYGLTAQSSFFTLFYDQLFKLFDYTRNGIGFAPLYIAIGAWSAKHPIRNVSGAGKRYVAALLVSMGLLLVEGIALKNAEYPRHDSMYIALVPTVYFLFQLMLLQKWRGNLLLRKLSTWIYIVHPIVIVIVRGGAKATGLTELLIKDSLVHFFAVTLLSILLAAVIVLVSRTKGPKKPAMHRAWVEINLNNVDHNLKEIRSVVPAATRIMAIVKADAYGHGSIRIAKRLYQSGVRSFAVAEIDEGIALRKNGLKGEILILGYTSSSRLKELHHFKLTQTVINADDGDRLQAFEKKLKVHIKINTGMNRLGESYLNEERICSMYQHKNLQVMGTFSHLTSADSEQKEDVDYTHLQLARFESVVKQVTERGCHLGLLHIQSSYGILNYPDLSYDIVRPGISLYGLLSNESDQIRSDVKLRPLLSLKARVTLVKNVRAGDPIGYGSCYTPSSDSKIATISIGYADGIPRELSNSGGCVIIRGQRAQIVGKICMDQMMVDITFIEGVRQGDIATLIGEDGQVSITAGEIAKRVGTITNEVVSVLGSRLEKVYL